MSIVRHVSANALMLAVASFAGIYLHPFSLHRVIYATREQFDAAPNVEGLLNCSSAEYSFRLPRQELSLSAQNDLRTDVLDGASVRDLSDAMIASKTIEYVRHHLRPAPADYQSSSDYPLASTQDCDQLCQNGTAYWSLCSDYARLTNACLQSLGLDSRILWLEGHVVVEYYDREFRKWVFLDPHLNRMAFTSGGKPLSIAQLVAAVENDLPTEWLPICKPSTNNWQDGQPDVESTWFRNVLLNGECHALTGPTLSANGRWDQLMRFRSRPTVIALSSPYDSSRSAFDAPLAPRHILLLYGILAITFYAGHSLVLYRVK